MLNFSLGAKRKFPWVSFLKCENTVDAHARIPFSARDGKNDSNYMDFLAHLARLKIQARLENTGLGFLARAELRPPGRIPLHVIDNLIFRGFVSEAGLKFQPVSRAEIPHVIRPLRFYE